MNNENLYVSDEDIKRSKSNFSTYPNEHIKYEGKYTKLDIQKLTLALQIRNHIMDALGYQILNAIYELNYSTSRQITEYLNVIKNINVDQNTVSKKLHNFNNLSIATQQSFVSDVNIDGTNMKFYCLDKNGWILLNGAGFICNWKATDSLDTMNVKNYLIRNQYIIKLHKEYNILEKLKLKKLTRGIGATYIIKNNSHIIIPVRNNINYKDEILKIVKGLSSNSEIISLLNKKIIFLGEDSQHIFNIFKVLSSNKLMTPNMYFVTDLKLFDRNLSSSFVRFGIKKTEEGLNVIMKEEILEEFL